MKRTEKKLEGEKTIQNAKDGFISHVNASRRLNLGDFCC
jgi:hypothetical protein